MHFQSFWYDQFLKCNVLFCFKVLTACAGAPKTVEILFNSYTFVPVTYKWVEAIPEDIFHVSLLFHQDLWMHTCVNIIYSIIISNNV